MDLEALGARIQAIRAARGMTLQSLADTSAVSVSMLSSVERGAKAPTVVVLDRIAEGLGVPLMELLAQPPRRIIRRAADQDTVREPGGWERTILTPVVPGLNFEWIRSTLPANCEAGTYPPYAAGSHEFIAVTEGTLTLTVDDEEIVLHQGDSLYLAADVTLSYANRTDAPCTYHVAAMIMRPRLPGLGRLRVDQ